MGEKTIVVLEENRRFEPELMYKFVDFLCIGPERMLEVISQVYANPIGHE